MRRIKSKDSQPELLVRRIVHRLGFRYRLHDHQLPGRPDLIFPSRKKIIFVHGCYWHAHQDCPTAHHPKSRTEYWGPKLQRNKERDQRNQDRLHELGWETLVLWECETPNEQSLARRIDRFLGH